VPINQLIPNYAAGDSSNTSILLLSLVFAYIVNSQRCVKTHLPCGGIYNNQIIANCLQNF